MRRRNPMTRTVIRSQRMRARMGCEEGDAVDFMAQDYTTVVFGRELRRQS
jgi:hypothetical protein